MSRLLTDTFEIAPTGFVTSLFRWSIAGNVQIVTTPVLDGTKCCNVRFNSTATNTLTAAQNELYIGFYFRRNSVGDGRIMQLQKGSTAIAALSINLAGNLYVTDGTSTLATSSKVLSTATKYHIQWHVKVANAGGLSETRLGDVSDISFTGDTQPGADTTVDTIVLLNNNTSDCYFDNVIVNSTAGSNNNSWPGIRNFTPLTVIGPGFYVNNWSRSPGTGANYDKVAEIPNDGDTTYLYTTSTSVYESFSMSDQALVGVAYDALLTSVVTRKDSGTGQLKVGVRLSGTDYMQAGQDLGTSYGVIDYYLPTNPAGGSWASGSVNAVEALIVSSAPGT